jgi:pyruvate dehydrogenase E1 component alpha subunit
MSFLVSGKVSLTESVKIYQVLTPEGDVVAELPDLPPEKLLEFYRWMIYGRLFSDRMVALQRQGRMGTFAPLNGQEATNVGIAAPLQPEDWLVGSYREALAYQVKGVPVIGMMQRWGGQVSSDIPREVNCFPVQIILATQMLHAVGIAQAIKYEQKPHVVVAVCGDGATSEGDFNEALNFAGVFKAPIIFVVQNNGWAISTPRQHQTAADYIADRGPAFGLPSFVVDGNDLLAVYKLMSDCIERARAGEGPALVEAITYRLAAHTTADDPTKYRSKTELDEWLKQDPLIRFHRFLLDRQILTDANDEELHESAKAAIQADIEAYEALPEEDPARLFDLVYAEQPPQLQRQKAQLLRDLGLDDK